MRVKTTAKIGSTKKVRYERLGAAPPATSRHTNPPLWLLPSGPDQVHGLSLREDQWSHHNVTTQGRLERDRRAV